MFFWNEIEKKNAKQKKIRPADDVDFQSDSDRNYGIYSGRTLLPYAGADSKLLKDTLTKMQK